MVHEINKKKMQLTEKKKKPVFILKMKRHFLAYL